MKSRNEVEVESLKVHKTKKVNVKMPMTLTGLKSCHKRLNHEPSLWNSKDQSDTLHSSPKPSVSGRKGCSGNLASLPHAGTQSVFNLSTSAYTNG